MKTMTDREVAEQDGAWMDLATASDLLRIPDHSREIRMGDVWEAERLIAQALAGVRRLQTSLAKRK